MPANGQAAAAAQLSGIGGFFSGFNQKLNQNLNTLNQATSTAPTNTSGGAVASATSAPTTAAEAPTKGNSNIFTGLCEALNAHQKKLVKDKLYEIADEYVINFASSSISGAQVVKPLDVTYKNTAAKSTTTAQAKLDSATDSVNVNSQQWNILAGTQIVQLIDQVIRSSRYITDQQVGNYDDNNKWVPSKTANPKATMAWYKISVSATQLGYDKKRRDNAYRMTFTVSPFAINQMDSPYFPSSTYRGAHKEYNYWFTGLNTQVLRYEQEYNNAYYTTISGTAAGLAEPPPISRDQRKRTYMATSEQRGQGQANYVNEPADSAAAFLYSINDFSEVTMEIVGDPAWMQQGEVSTGVNAQTFNFKPFNPDGTINFDSQEVVFTVSFNRPTDYDFNTGVMNTNASTGQPQEKFAFIATSCRNIFSKGKFTQELKGSLLPIGSNPTPSSNGRVAPGAITPAAPGVRDTKNSAVSAADELNPELWNDGTATKSEEEIQAEDNPPSPQPAPDPEPPTSTGDIDVFGGLAGTDTQEGVNTAPQEIARDDS